MKIRMKIAMALVIGAITATTGANNILSTPQIVFAQTMETEQKAASLNEVKVSFDGKVVTIQAYNIGGYNYVRARDITNQLNMMVDAYSQDGDIGIGIYSTIPATDLTPTEKLTEKTIKVTLTQGLVYYDGDYVKTDCFLYNGRYYFKIADIGAVAESSLQGKIMTTTAKGKTPNSLSPATKSYTSLIVKWNEATQTIEVNKVVTDLQKVYDNAKAGIATAPTASTTPNPSGSATATPTPTLTVKAQPELATAPEISATLANILIDPEKAAVDGNFAHAYTLHPQRGQCTWYAVGRFYETTGINISSSSVSNYSTAGGLTKWVENAMNDKYPDIDGIPYKGSGDLSNIPSRGLAVWTGHVIFIEYVERDSNGTPISVYVSEANMGHDDNGNYKQGVFYPDVDGIVRKLEVQDLLLRTGTFYGFVVAK